MTGDNRLHILRQGKGLLERAIGYTRRVAFGVNPDHLSAPTPCHGWDLYMLLGHLNDSLATLHDGIDRRCLELEQEPKTSTSQQDVLIVFRRRIRLLLEVWIGSGDDGDDGTIAVAGWPLHGVVLANTGALEIAVHGWDIAKACGMNLPIPPELASDLLEIARLVVLMDSSRHPQFAPPVGLLDPASPSDRLVAFLGRDPGLWLCPAGTGSG